MTKEKNKALTHKLGEFINVPRAIKTLLPLIASNENTKSEREDLVIIISYLIDEHLPFE